MPKKVSELTKELDISFQELKGYADKMGISISSARSSVEDQDADRLVRSINMMRGTSSSAQSGGNKPKIKAVPVVHKEGVKPKPPAGKPVIPKKPVVPEEEPAKEEAKAVKVSASMKKDELLAVAKEMGVEVDAKATKADIIAAIEAK